MDDPTASPTPRRIEAAYPDPLWIQVLHWINEQVEQHRLGPGDRLPPERQLAQDLGVSRVTLRKALNHLVDEGKIKPAQGRGWYVEGWQASSEEWPNRLESFSETAARLGLEGSSAVLRADTEPASLDLSESLGIPPGLPIFHLERVRMLGGIPIAIDSSQIPLREAPTLPSYDFTTASLFQALTDCGVELARTESTIEALGADAYVSTHLGIAVGDPILVMKQIALDGSDRRVFTSVITYAGQRYRLRTSFVR
ncbi:MAG: GntR family transcriptional regulator [Propionibacteriaceae bacterium]|jgi:DNA-binding GntR family transcriptional regulator|nr:GntR family transcriptional regulator [Propionibacteriaceae bacterium]